MKYLIYALVALLVIWAMWYLAKTIRRQVKGGCGCGCGGNCARCGAEKKKGAVRK